MGFFESALEEKIGLIKKDVLFGWAGTRSNAIQALAEFEANDLDLNINDIFLKQGSCFLVVKRNDVGQSIAKFFGPKDKVHLIESCGYEFLFAGSGSEILNGLRFTAQHKPLGENAKNAGWAALSAVSRFFSEEIAGRASQFYSLRTGGHYRVFYGSPKGIEQLHFSINNWITSDDGEPVVANVALPFLTERFEWLVEVEVAKEWQMHISNAIGLVPLLENPRRQSRVELNLLDVLKSRIADVTFHFCWQATRHDVFIVAGHEPEFIFRGMEFEKRPHRDVTIRQVRQFMSS